MHNENTPAETQTPAIPLAEPAEQATAVNEHVNQELHQEPLREPAVKTLGFKCSAAEYDTYYAILAELRETQPDMQLRGMFSLFLTSLQNLGYFIPGKP